jgi:ABC-type nitrate/sulfonate/bicarbonate transport system permease component
VSTASAPAPVEATGRTPAARRRAPWRARLIKYGVWIASLGVAWLIWELVFLAMGRDTLLLAGPTETVSALAALIDTGTLWADFSVTAREFVIAFAMAAVAGVAAGVLVGYWKPVGLVLRPWIAAGYSTPLIALTPLFIVWFGIGIWSKVAVGFVVMFFPILLNTALGVTSADKGLIEMMRSVSARQRDIISKVILRGSVPYVTTGCRIAVGRGVTAIVAAELLGANAGMGYRILVASQSFDTASILAYVVVLAVVGATLMVTLEWLDARVAARRTG